MKQSKTLLIGVMMVSLIQGLNGLSDIIHPHMTALTHDIENFLYDQFISDYNLLIADKYLSIEEKNAVLQTLDGLTNKIIDESLTSDITRNNFLFAQATAELYSSALATIITLMLLPGIGSRAIVGYATSHTKLEDKTSSPISFLQQTNNILSNWSYIIATGSKYTGIFFPVKLVHSFVDLCLFKTTGAVSKNQMTSTAKTCLDFSALLIPLIIAAGAIYPAGNYGYQDIIKAIENKKELEQKLAIMTDMHTMLHITLLPC